MNRSEVRELRRKGVVEAIVVRGEEIATVVRVSGVPQRTVFNWLARYRAGGWHALREGRRNGRPRKLSGKIMAWLYNAITMGDPRQFQLPFCLWTLDIIRRVFKETHGISLSKSSVSRLLRHMGLSPQRPIYRSYKRDPKELRKYLTKTYPAVKRLAKKLGARIYFVDEAAVRSDNHHGTTWARLGHTPAVEDSGDRFTLKLISAVSPRGDMHFRFIEGSMNADRFIDFLRKLRRDAQCPIVVIADNASYHKAKKVKALAGKAGSDDGEGIHMAMLPAYCPELNPDEQVWNHAKKRLGKLFVVTKDEMKKALLSIMRSIQRTRSLIYSFFMLKDTKYAAF
ncbi:MAG TPA: IS630 family transposase [Verrucomicrobiales bacterium]|nr:IS630 family transposase [Verrucomicrobiales bacterium]